MLVALGGVADVVLAQGPSGSPASGIDEVEVLGRRQTYRISETSTATKTPTPLIDIPQSLTLIGSGMIRDQAMQSMGDVVRYVPGVQMAQGEGHRDAPIFRGNASTADFFIDGMRDDTQYYRDLYNVEQVEVLKGPSGMIFGRGGSGGLINRVTKQADGMSRQELGATLGSWRCVGVSGQCVLRGLGKLSQLRGAHALGDQPDVHAGAKRYDARDAGLRAVRGRTSDRSRNTLAAAVG
jgi:catecholate siderophore receptor